MIVMEGLMLVPPERGTIIGRALWKPRYVVFGTGAPMKTQNDIMAESSGKSSAARKALKSTSSKPSLVDVSQEEPDEDGLYVSIYKAKGEWEFISQHPLSTFKSCEIRALAHRKQGPSLPTLMLEMKPDPMSDKARKRRSSRTGGLTTKDPWANILLFRTVPEERYNIYDWQVMIKPQLTPESLDESPVSPVGQYNNFTNPFSSSRDTRSSAGRPELQQRNSDRNTSSYPHAPRERPSALISPSPSLRSRRSDLSSQASSQHPPMGFTNPHAQNYATAPPADLPSPVSTSGYEPQFIEGWTAAQGRSSALSSHTRGSNSIASAVAPAAPVASTPPGPRETILDRAFQLRCIPGSERISEKDEDQLSSLARFEALMREVDERKQQKGGASQNGNGKETQEWNMDEDSEEDSDSAEPEIDNDDDSDEVEGLELSDDDIGIPTPAQRALDYISGRRTPVPKYSRPLSPTPKSPPVPFLNPQAMAAFHGGNSSPIGGLRPRTGTNSSTRNGSRPNSLALPSRSASAAAVPSLKDVSSSASSHLKTSTDGKEKRRSSTSVKRLSFQEFAKRLSSTSSLLLVQTNASSNSGRDGSRRTSSEFGTENDEKSGGSDAQSHDKRCGWRGSVGVFGGEGGFL